MAETIIALDAGGTAVKAAAYDRAGREMASVGEMMVPHRPNAGHMERDADVMWAAMCRCVKKVLADGNIDARNVAVVGLTGYGNGLLLVDAKGQPVRNGILSADQRAAGIVDEWRQEGLESRHIALAYQRLWAGKPLPLLAWLERNEPETVARAHHVMMCKDFLRLRLTGRFALEVSDSSSGSLIDQSGRTWSPALLDMLGLSQHHWLFGELLEPLTIAGHVTPEAASSTGLRAGTPVSSGYADGLAMLLALGVVDDSLLNVIAGTWGLNQLMSHQPITDGSILASMLGARPGDYILVDGSATSASTFEWFVNTFVTGTGRDAAMPHSELYDWCNASLAGLSDDDPAVYFLPWLNGMLDEPHARGSFIGMSSWHGLPHMVRAVFEGVALEHRRHVDMLLANRANRPRAVRFAGGAARSVAWVDIFAATFDLPIELSASNELGALGAAIIAAVAAGIHPDLESAVTAMTGVSRAILPDPRKVEVLARRREGYRLLRQQLEPVWSGLAKYDVPER